MPIALSSLYLAPKLVRSGFSVCCLLLWSSLDQFAFIVTFKDDFDDADSGPSG